MVMHMTVRFTISGSNAHRETCYECGYTDLYLGALQWSEQGSAYVQGGVPGNPLHVNLPHGHSTWR